MWNCVGEIENSLIQAFFFQCVVTMTVFIITDGAKPSIFRRLYVAKEKQLHFKLCFWVLTNILGDIKAFLFFNCPFFFTESTEWFDNKGESGLKIFWFYRDRIYYKRELLPIFWIPLMTLKIISTNQIKWVAGKIGSFLVLTYLDSVSEIGL